MANLQISVRESVFCSSYSCAFPASSSFSWTSSCRRGMDWEGKVCSFMIAMVQLLTNFEWYLSVHCYKYLRIDRLEGVFSHDDQHRPWSRVRRRRHSTLPSPSHMAGQTARIARGVLSTESAQHHEPTCDPGRLCRRNLSSGLPCGDSSQELTTKRNARIISCPVILYIQHAYNASERTQFQHLPCFADDVF